MLRDSYAEDKVFAEIIQLVPKMGPGLAEIDQYLEDDELFQLIRADFSKRWKNTLLTGRNSTPVEVVLRMLVVKRLYGYSYEETERIVNDSLTLRQFCRLYLNEAPDSKTIMRWNNLLRGETLEKFNGRVAELAVKHKITKGKKLRTDGTVVESNIHPPRDSRQLAKRGARPETKSTGGAKSFESHSRGCERNRDTTDAEGARTRTEHWRERKEKGRSCQRNWAATVPQVG